MASVKMLAVAGSAVILSLNAAGAADLGLPIVPAPVAVEYSGWYLRGDIGFTNQRVKSPKFVFDDGIFRSVNVVNKEFETGGIFGLGVGYQFNSWLRADVTGEYRTPATFHGYEIVTAPGYITGESNTLIKSEWVALANVYADLGTWWCITPFVGFGIGAANVHLAGYQDTSVITGPSGQSIGSSSAPAGDKWNLAWAVHAGLAYKVTPNFSVELAYRYLNLGDGQTGGPILGYDGTHAGARYTLDDIYSHDVKLGVRWLLNPPAPVMPLITKG